MKQAVFVLALGAIAACNQDDACPVPNLEWGEGGGGSIVVPLGGAGGLGAEPSEEPQAAGGGDPGGSDAEELTQGKCGDDTLKCKCDGMLLFESYIVPDDPDDTQSFWICDIRPGVKMPLDCSTVEKGIIKLCWERLTELLPLMPGLRDIERSPLMWWQTTPPEDGFPMYWKCRYEQ